MSKKSELLNYFLQHVGEWICPSCVIESQQTAAIFREIKAEGYQFEKPENSKSNWGQQMYCPHCGRKTTHYKLLSKTSIDNECYKTTNFTPLERQRVFNLLGTKDAYTGKTTKQPVIDHKTPVMVKSQTKRVSDMSDDEIKETFQVLSNHTNLVKANACKQCRDTGIRQALWGVNMFTQGDEIYNGTCVGCGYHDCNKFRETIKTKLNLSKNDVNVDDKSNFKSFKEYSKYVKNKSR